MDKEVARRKALAKALEVYREAVLVGLHIDPVDGCWQRAVRAMPFLFDKKIIEMAKKGPVRNA